MRGGRCRNGWAYQVLNEGSSLQEGIWDIGIKSDINGRYNDVGG